MAIKPILFNTEMVRAILEGRKAVTRRLIKPQPKNDIVLHCGVWQETHSGANGLRVFPPPYQVGDILYVRENWAITSELPGIAENGPVYMADYSEQEITLQKASHFKWHPSIHMPREIARIFLRVTEHKIVHLQEITADEALREGIAVWEDLPQAAFATYYPKCFAALWDTTIKPAEQSKYGWDANPWVWAIYFERCEKPEGF